MAQVTRDAYQRLAGVTSVPTVDSSAQLEERYDEPTLAELVEKGLLRPGDLLDPVDPGWVVDAVIDGDGTLVIDGVHQFDSLTEATHSLGVTNMSGLSFWALETSERLVPLVELVASDTRIPR